jgi:murein endopeptidase
MPRSCRLCSAAENSKYRSKLIVKAAIWARRLAARFGTYEVGPTAVQAARHRGEINNPHQHADPHPDEEDSDFAALLEQLDEDESVRRTHRIKSRSSGSAHVGSLLGGVQLPRHPGYRLVDASRAWGTSKTIGLLLEASGEIVAADPAAPRVEVHDLSLRLGGRMRGHKSHENGRDVDLTYYQRSNRGTCVARQVSPRELDALREWRLMRHWLERSQAEFIFVDYSLQGPLYAAAKADCATQRQLAASFQYPRRPDVRAGIIRHVPNHADHVHVRFRCSASDSSCMHGSRAFEPKPADEPESELLELLTE